MLAEPLIYKSAIKIIIALAFVTYATESIGAKACGAFGSDGKTAIADLIFNKSLHRYFASQLHPELRSAHDACGAVCAFNILQSLTHQRDGELVPNPIGRLNELEDSYVGGLNQASISDFFTLLGKVKVNSIRLSTEFAIKADLMLRPFITLEDLRFEKHLGQLAVILPFSPEKGLDVERGHWVGIVEKKGRLLYISDPNFPTVKAKMRIEKARVDEHMETLLLRPIDPMVRKVYEDLYGEEITFIVQTLTSVTLLK